MLNDKHINYVQGLSVNIVALTIIGAVILLWIALDQAKKKYKHINRIEIPLLFLIFTLSIYANGLSGNDYKFLYLIIIITYTIELGGRYGRYIAITSSCFILISGFLARTSNSLDADLALSVLFIVIAWTLGYYVKLEHTHIVHLTHISNIDGLTGAYNHRFFHECLNNSYQKSVSDQTPLSLIMIDIDFFKDYNDTLGHREGDALLTTFVKLISEKLRPNDLLFRYGGDEFCLILDNTTQDEALELSEKIRVTINNYKQDGMEHLPNKKLSVSIGVASVSDEIDSSLSLLDKADSALYRAKYLRKNCIETFDAVWHTFKELSNADNEDLVQKF